MDAFVFSQEYPIQTTQEQYTEIIKYFTAEKCITAIEITVENVFGKSDLNSLTEDEQRHIVDMFKPLCILQRFLADVA